MSADIEPSANLQKVSISQAAGLQSRTAQICAVTTEKRKDPNFGQPPDALLHALLERAVHDIERGWHAAALDALGRALRLIEDDFTLKSIGAAPRRENTP